MTESTTALEIDARGVATVTLNRPERNNAYNGDMIAELLDGAAALNANPDVRVVVLRGSGRHFQAGADLAWIQSVRAQDAGANLDVSRRTTDAVHALMRMGKPTVAMVHGGCFGGGTGIISACDIVLADRSAIFSITEARWGLIATPIVPPLLSRIGPGRARRYALTCERFGADRAFEIGLVDEVCDAGGLDDLAAPIIDALLHCPPEALAQSKEGLLKYAGLYFSDLELEEMARPHALKRQDAEADEGLKSFLEKRAPSWYPGAPQDSAPQDSAPQDTAPETARRAASAGTASRTTRKAPATSTAKAASADTTQAKSHARSGSASQSTAKPKPAARGSKTATKTAAKTATKTAAKTATKTTAKTAAKTAAKPTSKSDSKPASKPASKSSEKAAPAPTAKSDSPRSRSSAATSTKAEPPASASTRPARKPRRQKVRMTGAISSRIPTDD